MGDAFCYDHSIVAKDDGLPISTTCVLAVTGPGTAFGDGGGSLKSLNDMDGDTILLIEARDSGIEWPEPRDADIRSLEKLYRQQDPRGPSSIHGDGFHVAFADGAVWFLRDDTPFDVLKRFLTVEGAQRNDREAELAAHRLWP